MPRYKATGIIEGMAIRRRKEEASRLHLTISIPIPDNQQLLLYAAANQGNAIDFTLEQMQGALFAAANLPASDDDDDDDEPEGGSDELEQIFSGDGEPQSPESELVNSLLEGAQEQTDADESLRGPEAQAQYDEMDRAQAIANLASESAQNNGHGDGRDLAGKPRRGGRIGANVRTVE